MKQLENVLDFLTDSNPDLAKRDSSIEIQLRLMLTNKTAGIYLVFPSSHEDHRGGPIVEHISNSIEH